MSSPPFVINFFIKTAHGNVREIDLFIILKLSANEEIMSPLTVVVFRPRCR